MLLVAWFLVAQMSGHVQCLLPLMRWIAFFRSTNEIRTQFGYKYFQMIYLFDFRTVAVHAIHFSLWNKKKNASQENRNEFHGNSTTITVEMEKHQWRIRQMPTEWTRKKMKRNVSPEQQYILQRDANDHMNAWNRQSGIAKQRSSHLTIVYNGEKKKTY